jgi:hypothetical protein
MKKSFVVIPVILSILLAACGVKMAANRALPDQLPGLSQSLGVAQSAPALEAPAPTAVALEAMKSGIINANGAAAAGNPAQDRLLIMNVDLSIVVADPQTKMDAISALAKSLGGFVVSMNMSQTLTPNGEKAPEGSISIRIPANQLDGALSQIKTGVVEVQSENRSGQDITQQYTDLQSQLRALQDAETQLEAIMKNATKTEDVLNVFNQLESYRQQIEVIQGQIQYDEQASAYALVNVTLIAEKTIQPIQVGSWKPQGVARDAVQALVNFLQGFVNFLIYLVLYILPVLILTLGPIALIIWGIVALVRRRRSKNTSRSA